MVAGILVEWFVIQDPLNGDRFVLKFLTIGVSFIAAFGAGFLTCGALIIGLYVSPQVQGAIRGYEKFTDRIERHNERLDRWFNWRERRGDAPLEPTGDPMGDSEALEPVDIFLRHDGRDLLRCSRGDDPLFAA